MILLIIFVRDIKILLDPNLNSSKKLKYNHVITYHQYLTTEVLMIIPLVNRKKFLEYTKWLPREAFKRRIGVKQKWVNDIELKNIATRHRGNHRSDFIKVQAEKIEEYIKKENKVPSDYKSPFPDGFCIFCQCKLTKKSNIDEFCPISQLGRLNKVNCNPCCGKCNSSKNA